MAEDRLKGRRLFGVLCEGLDVSADALVGHGLHGRRGTGGDRRPVRRPAPHCRRVESRHVGPTK